MKYSDEREIGVEENYQCPSCQSLKTTHLYYVAEAFKLVYIPIFPVAKHIYSRCENCKLFHFESEFDARLKTILEQNRIKIKYPWYYYIIPAYISLQIFLIIIK